MSLNFTQEQLLAMADKIERGEPLTLPERVYACHEFRYQGGDPRAIEAQKRRDRRTQQWLDTLADEANAAL